MGTRSIARAFALATLTALARSKSVVQVSFETVKKVAQSTSTPVPCRSRFLHALFQFSKCAADEAAKFGRGGVEFLGVVGAARLECVEPVAEAGELIRRQLGNRFGDLFDFHAVQYSTAGAWLSHGMSSDCRREWPGRAVAGRIALLDG
jgi:hypothetical protein